MLADIVVFLAVAGFGCFFLDEADVDCKDLITVMGQQVLIETFDRRGELLGVVQQPRPVLLFNQGLGVHDFSLEPVHGQALEDIRIEDGPFVRAIGSLEREIELEITAQQQFQGQLPLTVNLAGALVDGVLPAFPFRDQPGKFLVSTFAVPGKGQGGLVVLLRQGGLDRLFPE
ncbi:hypothetical protein SDC9_190620 [bioreactor metagenome]|uniref:Uncharacterized protein n=1 Tax=bioreactor metagenome TaxID=1076179 RepID=A0A645HVH4_9ZZZZ